MRAAVLTAPGVVVEVATLPDPAPRPDEVVVEVAAAGICGTDLHIARGSHGALPVVPGHELAGTVVAVGSDVRRLSVGARVAVDPNLPCLACRACHAGRPNLCPDLGALGVTVAGGAAELVAAPARSCVEVPEGLPLQDFALAEPLSCAVRAYDVLRVELGARVLVYGAGTMGLVLVQLAGRAGAVRVDVVEPDDARRATASRLGCSAAAGSADELGGREWDVVVDASGSSAVLPDAVPRVASGGTYLQFGVPDPAAAAAIRPYDVYRRELTITGSMAVRHSFARAVDLLAAGFVDPSVLVTDRVPLDGYAAALEAFAAGHGLKTLVVPQAV